MYINIDNTYWFSVIKKTGFENILSKLMPVIWANKDKLNKFDVNKLIAGLKATKLFLPALKIQDVLIEPVTHEFENFKFINFNSLSGLVEYSTDSYIFVYNVFNKNLFLLNKEKKLIYRGQMSSRDTFFNTVQMLLPSESIKQESKEVIITVPKPEIVKEDKVEINDNKVVILRTEQLTGVDDDFPVMEADLFNISGNVEE